MLYPAARLQKEVLQILCNPQCYYKFPSNFPNSLMVPKMILRLGLVNLEDHSASSILVRHVSLPELREPSGRAHPVCSCMPLCQCKLQVVCCRERLHVTVFERASNYTKIQYFLKAFPSILVWRDPWFRQFAWSFLHTMFIIHRIHCSEEHRMSSSLEAFSSWN